MQVEKEFEILNKISQVEPNPFLFTRIQTTIKERLNDRLDTKRSIFYTAGITAIIVINVFVLSVNGDDPSSNHQPTTFDLVSSNQFYK